MPKSWLGNFDEFITRHWPKDVPEDCTDMQQTESGDGKDCLERNSVTTCASCLIYQGLAAKYAKLGRTY